MAINPYFKSQRDEQDIIEDLTVETIKIHGQNMVYIPRTLINKDDLFGEDVMSQFNQGYEIEMYISSIDGFEGEGDLISRFGLQIKDSMKVVVAKKRFEREVADKEPDIERPREGDLVYFPLSGFLFEITFVERENPFYQLGKLYTYELTCETHEFSYQELNTEWSDIDNKETAYKNEVFSYTVSGSSGNFTVGEVITDTNGKTAEVVSWTASTSTLEAAGATLAIGGVTGSISGTTGSIAATAGTSADITKDPFASNSEIQIEGIDFINFSDRDPFSEGGF